MALALLPLGPLAAQDDIKLGRQNAIVRAIELVSPAVASINVVKRQKTRLRMRGIFDDPYFSTFLPPVYRTVESLGSGLVVSSDGYVVTNSHVVENATEVIVTLPGGLQYDVEEIFSDPLTDIALLKIPATGLPTVRLGNSDNLLIGEWAIAIGNPLGLFDVSLQPTATVGIISGLHMNFGHQESRVYQDMIQTDASINPGNSGGPLVNASGEVIGINAFIFTENEYSAGSIGIGFAIPINLVKEIVLELRTTGRIDRTIYTGIRGGPVDRFIRRELNLPKVSGYLVMSVDNGSPADKAGVKELDVVLEVNGKNISSVADFKHAVEEDLVKAGDILNLTIWRDGRRIKVALTAGRVAR
ncbi:MAG: trypsin-like peptidase domain-containing protein [Candidatus Marinimicrobia bacterium]|nr:trypsin-like peptidase domain-containing protein [Candidatus Neomarinimicrobiota bacterium]